MSERVDVRQLRLWTQADEVFSFLPEKEVGFVENVC